MEAWSPLGYHPGGPGFLICSRPAVVEERSKCSSGRTDAVLGSEPESPAQFSLWGSRPICKAAYKTFHLDVSQNPHFQLVPIHLFYPHRPVFLMSLLLHSSVNIKFLLCFSIKLNRPAQYRNLGVLLPFAKPSHPDGH